MNKLKGTEGERDRYARHRTRARIARLDSYNVSLWAVSDRDVAGLLMTERGHSAERVPDFQNKQSKE